MLLYNGCLQNTNINKKYSLKNYKNMLTCRFETNPQVKLTKACEMKKKY